MARPTPAWLLTLGAVAAVVALWTRHEQALARTGATVFAAAQPGCTIVIPAGAVPAERRAAELLQATLARAAGRASAAFPIVDEAAAGVRHGLFVGATRRSADLWREVPAAPFDTAVGFEVRAGAVLLRAMRREACESAASWFLERQIGAQWFIPGPLGEYVPRRAELVLPPGRETAQPGFVSRDLGGIGGPDGRDWYARNRLEARFEHSHNLAGIFRPEDFRRAPEMAPMRDGRRHLPAAGDHNWQPNLLSPAAVAHAAAVVNRAFDADPRRLSFSLSTNDAIRFDDSPATLAAVGPPRYFRHRPDYADAVFHFTNAVAERVAVRHPDRWLPAYAYYWCENTPRFPIARNVVPFLTADRSQWFNPEFAAEDRALIERWCRSGAGLVGVYDYFYGAPFVIPRPTLYAVTQSIPFEHRAGVRAFYAETNPNWALDGPKPWLAAQLLWSPERKPDELLELYYRAYWAEAAAPMREFFALCEQAWLGQQAPPLWLRYFQDEHQLVIFPPERLVALRGRLEEAARLARSPEVRGRVALASAGFAVTEAFADFCAARERVARLARVSTAPASLVAEWRGYRAARAEFLARFARVRREQPLAVAAQDFSMMLRDQPDSRAARALSRSGEGRALMRESAVLPWLALGVTPREVDAVLERGAECLRDAALASVVPRPVGGSATIDWTEPTAVWRGSGEPWEGRSVRVEPAVGGVRSVRFAGCRTEQIGQWVPATGDAVYAASVKVRAKVSPGTAVYLIVSFLDEKGRHYSLGTIDRVPADRAVQEDELCVIARAPRGAQFVGIGLRVTNQIDGDFAEFFGPSLRRLAE